MSGFSLFSEELEQALLAAGWVPGRRVDTSGHESRLISEGYSISSVVREFLTEFSGLTIRWQHSHPDGTAGSRMLEIEPGHGDLARADVQHIEARVAEPLVPIGFYADYVTILMGASGKIYGEVDTLLSLIAYGGPQGLQAIFYNSPRLERIPW